MGEEHQRKRRFRVVHLLGKLALIVLGVYALMLVFLAASRPFRCVEMPNGFLIGRATVFSSLVGWAPDLAIRYPDGTLFSRCDNLMDFWDEDGFGGTFVRRIDGGNLAYLDSFDYLNNSGLFTQKDQPELYRSHFERKNAEWLEAGRRGANLYSVYLRLMENRENQRSWCPTDWFLPEEAA